MRKIIIFGAGYFGGILNNLISNLWSDDKEVCFYCDNNLPSGSYKNGIMVIGPDEIEKYASQDTDIYISSPDIVDEVITQLYSLSINIPVYMVPKYVYELAWNKQCPPLVELDVQKPRLPYLECRIVEYCNLNCRGCSVAANIREEKVLSLEEFENDLISLKRLFSGIKFFKLFGGEPLLHPQLKEMLELSRRYFPDAEIVVHSNGLLVPEMKREIMESMRHLHISFIFTLYPVTGMKKREIEDILNEAGVSYKFWAPVYEFKKMLNQNGDYDAAEVYKNCSKCVNLIDGTISCGIGHFIDYLEKYFCVEICDNKYENCVDIHTTSMNGWEINNLLNQPSNVCKYCSFANKKKYQDSEFFKWGGAYLKIRLNYQIGLLIDKDVKIMRNK